MLTEQPKMTEGFEEAIKQLVHHVKQFQPLLQQLATTPVVDMTPEERDVAIQLVTILKPLPLIRDILCNQAMYHMTTVLDQVEQLAKTGNPKAQKAYESLLPCVRAGFVLTPYSMERFL